MNERKERVFGHKTRKPFSGCRRGPGGCFHYRKTILAATLTILLATGFYTLNYHTPHTPEALQKATADFVEKDVELVDQLQVKNGMLITWRAAENPTAGGVIAFKRGWNGLWLVMHAEYNDALSFAGQTDFSDYGLLRPQQHTAVYSLRANPDYAACEIDYYDAAAYEKDGTMVKKTAHVTFTGEHSLSLQPYMPLHYTAGWRMLNEEGKVVDEGDWMLSKGSGEDSWSKTAAETDLIDSGFALILLLGFFATKKLWREEKQNTEQADEK